MLPNDNNSILGDFSALGNHEISVTTSLDGDSDPTNDEFSAVITKDLCQPLSNCAFSAIEEFHLSEISNETGCDEDGKFADADANCAIGS